MRFSSKVQYKNILAPFFLFATLLFGMDFSAVTPPHDIGDRLDQSLVECADKMYFDGSEAHVGDRLRHCQTPGRQSADSDISQHRDSIAR